MSCEAVATRAPRSFLSSLFPNQSLLFPQAAKWQIILFIGFLEWWSEIRLDGTKHYMKVRRRRCGAPGDALRQGRGAGAATPNPNPPKPAGWQAGLRPGLRRDSR